MADSTRNRTKQEDKIRNQELGCHVISIVYTLDTFRENINTLSLQYIKGQNTLWKYSIPTQQIVDVVEIESDIDNSDLKMAIDTIKEECNKPSWGKKTLKLALNAIQGIATGIAANQLTPIVTQALALL